MATTVVQSGPTQPLSREDFQVAILCALPLEVDAVEATFDKDWDDEVLDGPPIDKAAGDLNYYSTGAIGSYNVVVAILPGMGTKDSAGVATALRMSFPNIKLGLVVGICGIVPGDDRILGDVVISDGVVQIDFGRQTNQGFEVKDTLQDSLPRLPLELRTLITKANTLKERRKLAKHTKVSLEALQAIPELSAAYPGKSHDKLFESNYHHMDKSKSCDSLGCSGNLISRQRLEPSTDDPAPIIHFGTFGSGNSVIKSAELRDKLAVDANLVAFEMEGAGAWEHFPCLVIKSACDYADSHKNKRFQKYAAAVAAACVKGLLQAWKPAGTDTRIYNARLLNKEYFENCHRHLHPAALDSAFDQIERFEAARWLLQQDEFKDWEIGGDVSKDYSSFLVMEGRAFCGKTALMKEAVVKARDDSNTITLLYAFTSKLTVHASHTAVVLPSFVDFLKSLLGQLLRSPLGQQPLRDDAKWEQPPWSDIRDLGKSIKESRDYADWSSVRLQNVIKHVILKSKDALIADGTAMRIFVDGASECAASQLSGTLQRSEPEDDGYSAVLDYLQSLLNSVRSAGIDIAACVSRRPRSKVHPIEARSKRINVDTYTRVEVREYIKTRLKQLENQHHAFRLSALLKDNSSNGFTWARLVTGQIIQEDDATLEELESLVQTIPNDHERFYETALSKLMASTAQRRSTAAHMLQLCLVSYRALTVDEFRHAHAFKDDSFRAKDMEEWEKSDNGLPLDKFHKSIHRRTSGLMQTVPFDQVPKTHNMAAEDDESSCSDDRVIFTHPSVASFLYSDSGLCRLIGSASTHSQQGHLLFFKTCLGVLKHCQMDESDTLQLCDYACEFWLHHARECGQLAATVKLPPFMRNCASPRPARLVQRQIRLLTKSQAKERILLENQTRLMVLLSTMGCTLQLQEHLDGGCPACKQAIARTSSDEAAASEVYMRSVINAIIGGWNDTALFLLQKYPPQDINIPFGRVTLLYKACYFASQSRSAADREARMTCVRYLLSRGARASVQCLFGYEYPLHVAIALGNTPLLDELLKAAPDDAERAAMLTARRRRLGMTALHFAVTVSRPAHQRREMVEALLAWAPASLRLEQLVDDHGSTALSLAEGTAGDVDRGIVEMLRDLEL